MYKMVKAVCRKRRELMRKKSFWLLRVFRLTLFYIFRNEIWGLVYLFFTNLNVVVKACGIAGFILSLFIVIFLMVDMVIKKESIEQLPEKVENLFHNVFSFLESKIAS